jgi:hypothetical protein
VGERFRSSRRARGGRNRGRKGLRRRGSEDGSGVPAAGVREGSEEVARKLLRVDVVLVVSSVRAKRGRSYGTTVTPNGGDGQDGRCGVLVA